MRRGARLPCLFASRGRTCRLILCPPSSMMTSKGPCRLPIAVISCSLDWSPASRRTLSRWAAHDLGVVGTHLAGCVCHVASSFFRQTASYSISTARVTAAALTGCSPSLKGRCYLVAPPTHPSALRAEGTPSRALKNARRRKASHSPGRSLAGARPNGSAAARCTPDLHAARGEGGEGAARNVRPRRYAHMGSYE